MDGPAHDPSDGRVIADLAHAADSLTLARLGFALLLVGAVATDRLALAAWLLAAAWVSDALDGRVARASMRATRLGHLDLAVDTAVGAGVLIGMGFGGHLPVVLAIGAVVALGGGFLVLRNAALAFALQAMAYAWFMIVLWLKHPSAWWVPPATVAVLLVVGYRRLITMLVPAFLGGMAALVRRRRGRGLGLDRGPDSGRPAP